MTPIISAHSQKALNDVNPLVADWRYWMRAQRWSERTERERGGLVDRVAREAGVPAEELTHRQIRAFFAEGGFSASSAGTYWVGLNSWFEWLVDEGERDENPMARVRKPTSGRRSQRFLSTAHLEHLISSRMHARTRTMILLAAYQGLRVFEIAKVRGADVDLLSNELVVQGKGGSLLVMPLHPIVRDEAQRYGDDWWFPQWTGNADSTEGGHILGASVGRIIADAMKRANVPGTAHSLRRWHASEMVREGASTRIVQDLMRHASISTTERYLEVDDRQRRAALMLLPDIRAQVEPVFGPVEERWAA